MLTNSSNAKAMGLAVATLAALASPAVADMTVIESDDPEIAVGRTYPDGATVDVAAGKTVKLALPSDKTKVIKGTGEADTASGDQSAPFGGTRGEETPDE